MVLRTLKLQNFRNLTGEYTLSNGINVIIGKNGLGKTNFLESISFLASGKSFRTRYDLYAIKRSLLELDTVAFTRIEGIIIDCLGGELIKEVYLEKTENSNGNGLKKILRINTKRISQVKYTQKFHSVVFSPNTINLVISSPSERRRDLDDFLCMYDESYSTILYDYRKIVRNRNKIFEKLSEGVGGKEELDFWNSELIHLAPIIIHKRVKMVNRINKVIKKIGPKMFNLDLEDLYIEYNSKFIEVSIELKDISKNYKKKISESIHKELRACTTLYGPQREDFSFKLNSQDLKEMGSRGQQRLFSFIYKIAQWKILQDRIGYSPILLLDDLFSELDEEIQKNVCNFLDQINAQIIITTTSTNGLTNTFIKNLKKIKL